MCASAEPCDATTRAMPCWHTALSSVGLLVVFILSDGWLAPDRTFSYDFQAHIFHRSCRSFSSPVYVISVSLNLVLNFSPFLIVLSIFL